ncbi:MAG: hypothetical protein FJ290_24520 [Planctomycetes bacterium]|nr:hypothetical protein [Planctomycetota bacterium]
MLGLVVALLVPVPYPGQAGEIPKEFVFRARVTALTPDVPARIQWRWGGEGLGGSVTRGELTALTYAAPKGPAVKPGEQPKGGDIQLDEVGEPVAKEAVVVEDKAYRYLYLKRGAWSPSVPVASLKVSGKAFVTFMLEGLKTDSRTLKGAEVEFEFSYKGKVVKRLTETGPEGPTVGLVLPLYRLGGDVTPESKEFLDELCGLSEYARRRVELLEALPWAKRPVPRRFGILTDCGGYGEGVGYGIRHTNRAIVEAELRALRQLGLTGLRGAAPYVFESIDNRVGIAAEFARIRELHGMGYPVPAVRRPERGGNPTSVPEGAGCPYHPDVAKRIAEGIQHTLDVALKPRVDEVWPLTVDEIGSVFDGAPEGKGHQSVCPRCIEGFREFVKGQGLTLADFGAKDWSEVRPNVYAPPADWPVQLPKEPWLPERGWGLLTYLSRRFNCIASARLFTPLRDACDKANEAKRKALAESNPPPTPSLKGRGVSEQAPPKGKGASEPLSLPGRGKGEGGAEGTGAGAGQQPWVFSFALRGNNFLMGGHSLDFFDFYRHADNAFVYETSNRDPRVWQWDSYLCDVGRVVSEKMGKCFGIYVKPHRGAPIQRALAALSRGATMLFWYTYGPDYSKGDSFSQRPDDLVLVSKAARIIAAAEDVLYGGTWAVPAEVAVVRPLSSEYWGSAADWENGKWVYTALQHAHVPVDPLDEEMLAGKDTRSLFRAAPEGFSGEKTPGVFSQYKVIYVSGSHLKRSAAAKLADWVKAGGTLYTSAGGLAFDEANQPLDTLAPVLGLKKRNAPELWCEVRRYGATGLATFRDPKPMPAGAMLDGRGLAVGREALQPGEGAEALTKFADGAAAVTRHPFGKGQAIVAGLFIGLEYAARAHRDEFDMSLDFDPVLRRMVAAPALEAVKPVVDASQPLVEGILVRNKATGKRAVALVNWAYKGRELVPCENLTIAIRGAGDVSRVTAAWLEKQLPITKSPDAITVALPRLDEAEVLLLE